MPCTRRGERLAFLCITALAVATRYFRLTEPAGIVFDETHFGARQPPVEGGSSCLHGPVTQVSTWAPWAAFVFFPALLALHALTNSPPLLQANLRCGP